MASPPSSAPARLRILLGLVAPHRRTLLGAVVLGLFGTAATLATPLVVKWVLDSLGEDRSLVGPVVALAGVVVVGGAITLWEWLVLGRLAERVVLDARRSMVRHYFAATVASITGRSPGEMTTRVTSDTVLLREAATSSLTGLVNGSIALVGTLVLMGILDVVLLATTVVAVVVVGAIMALLMPAIARAEQRAQDAVGRMGGTLEASLRAVRTVKAARAEERQAERILVDAERAATESLRAVRREAVAWTVSWAGIQLAIIVILGLGAWRVEQDLLAVSTLIAFLLYAFQLMEPVVDLTQNLTKLQSGIAAAARIGEVALLPREQAAQADGVPHGHSDAPLLELRRVTVRHDDEGPDALRGVSLCLPRRGHVALVGPSGAGKSTVFAVILGFLEPRSGTVLWDGVARPGMPLAEVRGRVAYVEQETPALPGTVRDNLAFVHPDASDDELWQALAAVALDGLVASWEGGLDASLNAGELSGGQRQRFAAARAMVRTPQLLMLDEASAQLDGLTELALRRCIDRQAARGTVITIAHRLSTVLDADRIVVMEEGQVRAEGTHRSLMASDALYRGLVAALSIGDLDDGHTGDHGVPAHPIGMPKSSDGAMGGPMER